MRAAEKRAMGGPGAGPPAGAADLFGAALGKACRYAELLAGPGVERGIVGPGEATRLWQRHLLNCAAVAELVPSPATLVDLGSGAGLPGIVLALLLPEVRVTLLEPLSRRVQFLRECVAELELGNAEVLRARAEDAAGQLAADVVTARAVAPMDRLAGLALGLARPGGLVLAIKGASAAQEVSRALPVLRRLGMRDIAVVRAGSGRVEPATTVIRLTAGPAGASSGQNVGGRGAGRGHGSSGRAVAGGARRTRGRRRRRER
jgi:16S rRNA (guanine527-N7)-methyltransferase